MSDAATHDMSGAPAEPEPSHACYLLTSPRHLLRILDVGLVVAELVAIEEREIRVFTGDELGGLSGIGGYPKVPIIIELFPDDCGAFGKAIPAEAIKSIHFPSEEDKTDFTSRIYENVPVGLFELAASPALFRQTDSKLDSVSIGKVDKAALSQNYRSLDVESGLLHGYMEEEVSEDRFFSLLADYAKADSRAARFNILSIALVATEDELSRQVAEAYLGILSTHDLDEGWVAKDVLAELTELFSSDHSDLLEFTGWQKYCSEVLSGARPMRQLADEKHIVLRAILLHLLNPDAESIERIGARDPAPGPKVLQAAMILASARTGFAPMVAAKKESHPGAYFLLSALMAAKINEVLLDMTPLQVERADETVQLLWRQQRVQAFAVPVIDDLESAGITAPVLTEVAALVSELSNISSANIEGEVIAIVLDKNRTRMLGKPGAIKLTRGASVGTDLTMISQLLDFKIKSHKLVGPKALDALRFQSEHCGSGFQFFYEEEVGFFAQVVLRPEQCLNKQALSGAIDLMIKSNEWMKSSNKK